MRRFFSEGILNSVLFVFVEFGGFVFGSDDGGLGFGEVALGEQVREEVAGADDSVSLFEVGVVADLTFEGVWRDQKRTFIHFVTKYFIYFCLHINSLEGVIILLKILTLQVLLKLLRILYMSLLILPNALLQPLMLHRLLLKLQQIPIILATLGVKLIITATTALIALIQQKHGQLILLLTVLLLPLLPTRTARPLLHDRTYILLSTDLIHHILHLLQLPLTL